MGAAMKVVHLFIVGMSKQENWAQDASCSDYPAYCMCICDHLLCRKLLLSLEQAQEASSQCLRSSEQQMHAQLQDKDSQLQSAQVYL